MNWQLFWGRMSPTMFVGSIIAIIGTCVTVAGVVVQNSFKGIEESYGIALHNSGMIVMLVGGVECLWLSSNGGTCRRSDYRFARKMAGFGCGLFEVQKPWWFPL